MPTAASLVTRLAAPIVVLATSMTLPSPASAAAPMCRAFNTRTDRTYIGADQLDQAIDDAARGDTLRIRGHCVGTYVIGRSLRLIGVPTAAYPVPSLDGDKQDHVLVTSGDVRIYDLAIKDGGRVTLGGGIFINRGSVLLGGRTIVVGNSAKVRGGGINAEFGRLLVTGGAAVRRNRAGDSGGGISTGFSGSVHVTAHAVIRDNVAIGQGGGIYVDSTSSVVGGHAAIKGNRAGQYGAGIANYRGHTELRWHAMVVRNVAGIEGGGWHGFYSKLRICSRFVSMRSNSPDDARKAQIVRC